MGSLSLSLFSAVWGMSSASLLSFWVFLEINLIAFVTFMLCSNEHLAESAACQYFIVQAFSSLIIIISAGATMSGAFMWSGHLMSAFLIVKLGLPPFHSWFLNLVSSVNWETLFTVSSIQKILPLSLLGSLAYSLPLWSMISLIVGGSGIFMQVLIKKFLGYSSIFSGGWLLASLPDLSVMYLFLLFYLLSLMFLIIQCSALSSLKIQTMINKIQSWPGQLIFSMSILSMAGLPPTLGFITKVWVISACVKKMSFLMVLILSSLFALPAYLSLLMKVLLVKSSSYTTQSWDNSYMVGCVLLLGLPMYLLVLRLSVWHENFWYFKV